MKILMTTLALMLMTFATQAQTYKNGFSYKLIGVDYATPLQDELDFNSDNLTYGVDVSYRHRLSNSFDLSLPFRMGVVQFPEGLGGDFVNNQELFLGLDATLQYHFANGYILPQTSKIRPYLLAGVGATYIPNYDNKFIGNLPVGVGIDLAISDNVMFTTQAEYRFLQEESYVYSAGLKFLLNENTSEVTEVLPKPLDSDFDGIVDSEDFCPLSAGTIENKGCPDIKPAEMERLKFATKAVEFEFGKSKLKASSLPILDEVAVILNNHPNYDLSIEGHTDKIDTKEFNKQLSIDRAKACYDYLISKGVSRERIAYSGYGETQPIDTNETEAGRQNNRRVEFKITKQ